MRLIRQHKVRALLLFTALGWSVLAVVLLAWPSAPTVGVLGDAGQHLGLGLVLSVVCGGVIAAWKTWQGATVGWVALAGVTVSLFLLEVLQIPISGRSFQWEDLAFGAFGGVLGGAIVTVGTQLGRTRFTQAAAGVGGLLFLGAFVAVVAVGSRDLRGTPADLVVQCSSDQEVELDWSLVLIDFSSRDGNCIETAVGPLTAFGEPLDPEGGSLRFGGGGVASGALDGLASSIAGSSEVTFGIRFNAGEIGEVGPPVVLARLIIDEDPNRPLLQILQRGPHLASNTGSGRPTVGIGSVLADTLELGALHEYVVTYANGEAVTYLDGQPLARSTVPPMRFQLDAPISLEIGWRTDERWEPFIGTIEAVVVADRALAAGEVEGVFGSP